MFDLSIWLGTAALALMVSCVLIVSVLWAQRLAEPSTGLWLLSVATLGFSQVVLTVTALGLLGLLSTWAMAGMALAFLIASVVLTGRHQSRDALAKAIDRWTLVATKLKLSLAEPALWPGLAAVALMSLVLSVKALAQPPLVFDDLLYHLAYPADWLTTGRLDNPYHLWGALTAPYYGLNPELVYYWLLAPWRSDVFSKIAQLPALVLLSIALYSGSRLLAVGRMEATLSALLPWANPSLITQAFFTASSDLWAASLSVISAVLSLAIWRGSGGLIVPASLAAGLFLGTRSYSAVYAPVLVAMLLAAMIANWSRGEESGRPPCFATLAVDIGKSAALVFATGGWWYSRNLLLIGNPIQPSTDGAGLSALGRIFAEGPYYRLSDFMFGLKSFGISMPIVLLGFLAVAAYATVRDRKTGKRLFVARLAALTAPLAIFAAFNLIPPALRDGRYLMPAYSMAYLSVGIALLSLRRQGLGRIGLGAGATAVAAYPLYAAVKNVGPAPETIGAAIPAAVLLVASGLALASLAIALAGRRAGGWRIAAATLMVVAACALAGVIDESRSQRYENWGSRGFPGIGDGWRWVERTTLPTGAVVAYSGNNLPYPLFGSRYQNQVLALPLDGNPSSVRYGLGQQPRPLRVVPSESAWNGLVASSRVDYLFTTNSAAAPTEFPLEDHWAREDPARFTLAFQTDGVRIYRVHTTQPASASER